MPTPETPAALYRYRIRGQRMVGEPANYPPEEIVEGTSELNAADIYFLMHGKRRIAVFERVVSA